MLNVEGLKERVLDFLKRAGVIKYVHCVGSSERHLNVFVDFEGVFKRPEFADDVAWIIDCLADGIVAAGLDPEVILGPANGGNTLAVLLALALERRLGHPVRVVMTTKLDGKHKFRVEADESQLKDRRTLLVDDVSLSGGSGVGVARPSVWLGANIIGFVTVVDRERLTAEKLTDQGVVIPYYGSLIELDEAESWSESECQHGGPCSRGERLVPVNSHTRDYMVKLGLLPPNGNSQMT